MITFDVLQMMKHNTSIKYNVHINQATASAQHGEALPGFLMSKGVCEKPFKWILQKM